jgi:3-deoxy-D-manno-octulosonic-acid transferase
VWFHVASAGELLQALPVLERFLADGAQCALTVTSVSGHRWAEGRRASLPGLIVADYLPADHRRNARRMLALLRPAALVHVKYDLWPNLVWEARRAGVPQFLVSATLHPRSRRVTGRLARAFYRALYPALDAVFAVSAGDRERFLHTAPGHPAVEVLGDTRFDSVLQRKKAIAPPPLPPYAGEGPVLVVGSSWPPDETCIFPALKEALRRHPRLRLILVPHEIDEHHLSAIAAAFAGHPTLRFSAAASSSSGQDWRVLLVDVMGLLSSLYAYATLAYVGGAFTTGVHNVMEPAVMGAPPIFGPFHQNAPEAVEMVARGCAFSVADGEGFRRVLTGLLEDLPRCRALGEEARAYVESRAGAAQAAFQRIRAAMA